MKVPDKKPPVSEKEKQRRKEMEGKILEILQNPPPPRESPIRY